MDQSFQWVITCCKCESTANFYCKECSITLCLKCKEHHQNFEETKHHTLVLYSERLQTISHKCKEHPVDQLVAWCDTCWCSVCLKCMTSAKHKKHSFYNFEDKMKDKRSKLQSRHDEMDKLLSEWRTSIDYIDKKKENVEATFEEMKSEIISQTENIVQEVNRLKSDFLETLQEEKKCILDSLSRQKIPIHDNRSLLERDIQTYEDILRSNDAVKIIQFDPIENHYEDIPASMITETSNHMFMIGDIDIGQLNSMLGDLVLKRNIIQKRKKDDVHLSHSMYK